jgi:hypothetical protein
MRIARITAHYYRQFNADYNLPVPAEGYGGWQRAALEFDLERTAVVVMHAWDTGTPREFPGWYRACECLSRTQQISRDVFPALLAGVRRKGLNLFHVVGCGKYYDQYPGYQRAVRLAGPAPVVEKMEWDPTLNRLWQFRCEKVFVGAENQADVDRGFQRLGFTPEARPLGEEGVAENAEQLFALCKDAGVNHLIYAGFCVNWCLLMSPGGMLDMSRRGILCSAFRQAVTAVENKESARTEAHKEEALWRIALAFGFVFDVEDFLAALG